MLRQKGQDARSIDPTVPDVGDVEIRFCNPLIEPVSEPSPYMASDKPLRNEPSPLSMRSSSRSIMAFSPEFWSSSRPEMETASAACLIGYSAAVITWLGLMFNVW